MAENYRNFVATEEKVEWEPNKHGVYALDCEMCYTTLGFELVKITLVDYMGKIVYEKLVKPKNQVLNFNTNFSGLTAADFDGVSTSLADVQQYLLSKFSSKTILIGHSLESDMQALKMLHEKFVDTAQLYPHNKGLPFKKGLVVLMKEQLSFEMRRGGSAHDSREDARSALRLVRKKMGLPDLRFY